MDTILQRYKFPADMQGTYRFILKQFLQLAEQAEFVQKYDADSDRGDVFHEEDINGKEAELDCPLVGQLGFQDLLVDTYPDKNTGQHSHTFPTKGNLILAKNSLKLSRQGYELMDKKRSILASKLDSNIRLFVICTFMREVKKKWQIL